MPKQIHKGDTKMKKLEIKSLQMKYFSDSYIANSTDRSSQLSFIILLCKRYDNCNVLYFSWHKIDASFVHYSAAIFMHTQMHSIRCCIYNQAGSRNYIANRN